MVQYSQIRRNIADFSKRFPSDSDAGTKINVDVASNNFVLHAERKPTGQTSGNLKLKDHFIFSGKRYNLSTTVKTGDVQELSLGTNLTDELEVRVGAVARTPVINKEGRVTDNAGASFGVTYNTRKCGLATDVKYIHQKDIQLELSTACQYKQFILGGKTKFNVQEQDFGAALKNLEVGARGDFDRYSTYVVLSDEFNGVKGGVEYKMDNNDLVFAESEYSLNSKNNDSVKLAVGVEKRLASGAVASVRLTDKFELGASYKARVNENLVATVAASVDTKNANTSKVGLDLNFHF